MSIVTFQNKADRNRSKVCLVDPQIVNLKDELKDRWERQRVQLFSLEKDGLFPPLSDMFVYGVDSMDVELRCYPMTDFIGYRTKAMKLPDGVQVQVLDHIRCKRKEYRLNMWEKEWRDVRKEFDVDLHVMQGGEDISKDPVMIVNKKKLVDEILKTSTVFRKRFISMELKNPPSETNEHMDYQCIQLNIYEFDNHAPVVAGWQLKDKGSRKSISAHTRDMHKLDGTKEVFYDGGARYTYDLENNLLTIDLIDSTIKRELDCIMLSRFKDESEKSYSINPNWLYMMFIGASAYKNNFLLVTSLKYQFNFLHDGYFRGAIYRGLGIFREERQK